MGFSKKVDNTTFWIGMLYWHQTHTQCTRQHDELNVACESCSYDTMHHSTVA